MDQQNHIKIQQFELADEDALLSFLRKAYPDDPRKSEPAFWRWHYLENPYTSLDDIPLWIVRRGKEIVGQVATIPVDVKVGSAITRAIWILDFVILPEYRGRGLGKQLMLTATESVPTQVALGMNEQSARVLRSVKWVTLGGVHRYHRLLYPGDAFGEIARVEPLRRLINLGYAPFRPRHARASDPTRGVIREVTTFDDSFADLWERASTQWPCAVVRSPRYLEWQFARQPGKKFDVLGLYDNSQLLGYVVLFFRKAERHNVSPKAAISDLCYDASGSPQVIDILLDAALHLALERRAGSLVTDVLDPRVEARLQRLGFWRIKSAPEFMASPTEYQDLMHKESNWFLTRGDSDVSIFEDSNL
jgi:GNAT superfamily N-acetyltransferase